MFYWPILLNRACNRRNIYKWHVLWCYQDEEHHLNLWDKGQKNVQSVAKSDITWPKALYFLPLYCTGVKLDPSKAWCPVLECQAVCSVQPSTEGRPAAVACPTCQAVFCSGCRGLWQDDHTCPEQQLFVLSSLSKESRSVITSSKETVAGAGCWQHNEWVIEVLCPVVPLCWINTLFQFSKSIAEALVLLFICRVCKLQLCQTGWCHPGASEFYWNSTVFVPKAAGRAQGEQIHCTAPVWMLQWENTAVRREEKTPEHFLMTFWTMPTAPNPAYIVFLL